MGEVVAKSRSLLFGKAPGKIVSKSHYFRNGVVIDQKNTDIFSIHLTGENGDGINVNKCVKSKKILIESIDRGVRENSGVAKVQCENDGRLLTFEMNIRELQAYLKRMSQHPI